MHLRRISGTVVALATVVAVLGSPNAQATATEPVTEPVTSFSFGGTCRTMTGEFRVRETGLDDQRMRVSLLATGLAKRRWHGEFVIQPHRYAEIATYQARTRHHRVRRSTVFDTPVASTMVTASLYDRDHGAAGCELGGGIDDLSATVSGGGLGLSVWTYDTNVTLMPSAECSRGSTWRVAAKATYADGDVRRFTDTGRCRHGSLWRAMIDLPDIGVPRALEAVVRDRAGHVGRAWYRVASQADSSS